MRASALRWAMVATPLALAGCASGVLDPQGPVGASERTILFNALAIMLAIVIPTCLAVVGFAWWFRASNTRARYQPDFVYSGQIELVVWSIPTLVIIFLGGIIWIGSHQLDPTQSPTPGTKPLDVQVVSLDWKWLFIYPDQGVASLNRLVIPAGTPVRFSLTSASVMNAFFIPQLGSMIYTMNGMTTQLMLQADHDGTYYGRSTHFSGDGFSGMQFTVQAMAATAFETWVGQTRGSGPALDRARYIQLTAQSADVPAATFGSVDPDLFHAIVSQGVAPGPGPQTGKPDPTISPRPGG